MQSYTVKAAAAELGVSPALLYSLVARGRIAHERHGLGRGVIRIPPDALARYREGCRRGVPEAVTPTQLLTVTPPPTRPRYVRMKP